MGTPDQGPWTGAQSHHFPEPSAGSSEPVVGGSGPAVGSPRPAGGAGLSADGPYAPRSLDPAGSPPRRTGLGLLLLAPAALALLLGFIIPTFSLLLASVRATSWFSSDTSFVGFDNYAQIAWGDLVAGLLLGAAAGLAPALVGIGVGLLIGRLLARAPSRTAAIGLGIVGAALVTVAPMSFALSTDAEVLREGGGLILGFLAVGTGAALVIGAVVGRLADGPGSRRLYVLTALAPALAGIAIGWQTLTPSLASGTQALPASQIYQASFLYALPGVASAIAVVLLLPLVLFGVVVTALLVGTRFRLAAEPAPGPGEESGIAGAPGVGADAGRPGPTGLAGVVLAGVAVVLLLVAALPWLTALGLPAPELGIPTAPVLLTTWGSALINAVVGTAVAAAGGYAIGYLRVFGAGSEKVLWVFAPWLFVGLIILSPAYYGFALELGLIGRPGLDQPVLSVPALFVLTFCFGAARRSRDPRRAMRFAGVVTLLLFAVDAWLGPQGQLWQWLNASSGDSLQATIVLLNVRAREFLVDGPALGLLTPVPVVILFAAAFAFLTSRLARARLLTDGADEVGAAGATGPFGGYPVPPGPYGSQPTQPGPYGSRPTQPGPYGSQPTQPGPYGAPSPQPGTYPGAPNPSGAHAPPSSAPGPYGPPAVPPPPPGNTSANS